MNLATTCTCVYQTLSFNGVRVTRSLVFRVVFCRSLFVLLSFFCWSLYCLSFDLRVLITLWYLQTLLSVTVKKMCGNNATNITILFIYD
jgi:hypothetical protein